MAGQFLGVQELYNLVARATSLVRTGFDLDQRIERRGLYIRNCLSLNWLTMKILVLGIGNILLTDEGVGIHVLEALRAGPALPEGVELLDGGTLSFTLAGPIQDADALVVVDAANISSPAGTWRLLEGEAVDTFLLGNRKSTVHEVGLTDLRAIAMLAGHWPSKRAMVAIQPQVVDWGELPTPDVAAAIPAVAVAIFDLVEAWQHEA
jgi:hydrogenase maturation protease